MSSLARFEGVVTSTDGHPINWSSWISECWRRKSNVVTLDDKPQISRESSDKM